MTFVRQVSSITIGRALNADLWYALNATKIVNSVNNNNCKNQRFQKGLHTEVEVKETETKGFGLFAKKRIEQDAFIIEYVGQIVSEEELGQRN